MVTSKSQVLLLTTVPAFKAIPGQWCGGGGPSWKRESSPGQESAYEEDYGDGVH